MRPRSSLFALALLPSLLSCAARPAVSLAPQAPRALFFSSSSTTAAASYGMSDSNNGELDAKSEQLIADAQALFSAKPSEEIFTRWSPDALFEDPICLAVGARQYKAQWYGLAKAFSGSMTRAWRVESVSKEQIKYVQKQWYKVAGFEKEMISTVVMKLNKEGKVTHFIDMWNHKAPSTNPVIYALRRLNGMIMPLFVGVPKAEQQKHKDL
ncbi:hypothetical protein FA09DRAFT_330736 [Tilletiopsis washingtonensis]|uniref:SnoaL-like domain-containing protein n=1 Tax=Tilletiopsis washingtonensis TaxID=58919 RepID=A0A316Z5P0_9BASI|nr:hypothetical protein FA09DRAFT_330736 [Tilletiopsis washingtonensis]PWN97097.1 hypothetical protein FA09DRAFT_330736 [Tilletiopsis washingtonensis]